MPGPRGSHPQDRIGVPGVLNHHTDGIDRHLTGTQRFPDGIWEGVVGKGPIGGPGADQNGKQERNTATGGSGVGWGQA
jgi:hypothetical protein